MVSNWGNIPAPHNTIEKNILWREQCDFFDKMPVLAHGNGRSYGDVCLNNNGVIINTRALNRFIHFDNNTGQLICEAGCLLSDILTFSIPRGWMLPVVPGTQFVTVGGAIANDIHGKNHHMHGTFGIHVKRFALLRSSGKCIECSATHHPDLFAATIGGIGLTGLILWADIQLMPVASEFLSVVTEPFYGLDAFFALSQKAEKTHEYTVAWLDCHSSSKKFARGLLMSAHHTNLAHQHKAHIRKTLSVPFFFPSFVLNNVSVRAFNEVYFYAGSRAPSEKIVHYDSFFFPLDSIHHWNRIYGRRGFYQYQCVVPLHVGIESIGELVNTIVRSQQGSGLSVLKIFGDKPSPGILSFPMPGITLALDFPNKGEKTLQLLNRLDDIVMNANGRVYLAKDARLNSKTFDCYYGQQWKKLSAHQDPAFSSSLLRRVKGV